MKNLSLQMTPATALKPTANKSEGNIDKSASTEPSAFNTMLSNQLQTQAQTKQLQDRQSQDKKSANKLTQDRQLQGRQQQDRQLQDKHIENKQLQDKQLQDNQGFSKQAASKPELAPAVPANKSSSSQPALSEAGGKVGAKTDKAQPTTTRIELTENKAAAAANTAKTEPLLTEDGLLKVQLPANNMAENNAASLVAAFNVAVVNPQLQAQSAEAAGTRQKNMDNILNQALTQSKTVAVKDAALAVEDSAGAATHNANWLDGVLPTAMRQAAGDELTQTKLQQAGMQQALSQQNSAQLTSQAQNNSQHIAVQQSAMEQNQAQSAGIFAATMPASLQAVAAGPALATAQAGSSNFINASPGKSGWDQAISQKVMWMAGEGGVQSATLTLNPPDLGPLQVVIHVNNDQVEAQFMSDNADVRQALQDGLANLRDKMNEAGIQLGQTNVSAGGQAQQQFGQAAQGQRAQRMSGGDSVNATETVTTRPTAVRSANGLVDTFA